METFLHLSLLYLGAIAVSIAAVYVEESGSPYDDGSLTGTVESFALNPQDHSIPMRVNVYYPTVEDEFAVVGFFSGFDGIVPPVFYKDWIGQLAAHGFIVLAPFGLSTESADLETLQWLEENLETYLGGPTASFENLGLACHSAGCTSAAKLLNSTGQAVIMFDPAVFLPNDVDLPVRAVMHGTNASCNIPGYDYMNAYSKWQGPKIRTGSNLFGHCDILDEFVVPLCHVFCPGGGHMDDLELYRMSLKGMAASLFINTLQGREDVIDYLLDPDLIPIVPTDHITDQW